ncbi:MAG: lysozyme inhibitor LprI family protein [Pseudomonadota bacterium]
MSRSRALFAAAFAGLALLAASAAAPARANEAVDSRFVSACLDANLRSGAAAAERRCVGLISRACMNGAAAGADAGRARCLRRETAAWESVRHAAWSQLEPRVKAHEAAASAGRAHDALRAAQAAWESFAQAECGYARALWGEGSFREVAGADCRMNLSARRAIQLRAQLGAEG